MARQGKVEAYEYIADADLAANGGLVPGLKTKINIENLATAAVPDASETVKGKAELATLAEAIAGADTTRIVTPAGLAAAIAAIFGDVYMFFGSISTTAAPAITINPLIDTFVGLVLTPANTGTGVWTITANLADTFKTTSLIICNRTYSEGTVELGYVRTSDTVLTLTTRGVPGSAGNFARDNYPLIVITPKV